MMVSAVTSLAPLSSLRGAQRRSNPDLVRGPGLLRFARNDAAYAAPSSVPALLHRPDGLGDRSLLREDRDELLADILQQHRVGVVVLPGLVELHPLPGHDGLLVRHIG